jgi:predicted RNase H-like HicB family nuclease
MLMPVRFTKDRSGSFVGRVPGIPAVGEGDLPTEALATLAIVIQMNLKRL